MILLKNCKHIVTCDEDDQELQNYDVLIQGQTISDISQHINPPPKTEIIDCSNHVVLPGFVNTHHHFFQILTRNLRGAQDAKLFDWLVHLYPIWATIDADAVYYSTLLATAELLKTGATTTSDHMYLYPDHFEGDMMALQFQAAEATGIRFAPSRGAMTRGMSRGGLPPDSVVQNADSVLKDMQRTLETYHDPSPFSMRRVIFAPCAPFNVDESVMRETVALGKAYNTVIHTHLAETQDENEYCQNQYGMRPLALMEKWGWLGENVYFAHGIWFSDDELELLKHTGTGISHCPTSNMRLGSGIARIKDMLQHGITVGLGVDGSASNDSSDMLGEIRNAMLLQRVRYGSQALSARTALKMATVHGAALLHFDHVGKIKSGFAADMAIFNVHQLQYAGALQDPVAALVFSGYNHEVDYTLVNGKIVVRHGKVVGLDEEYLLTRVNDISQKLASKGS